MLRSSRCVSTGLWGRDTDRAMSQENVDLVRQATEAFSRGDFERFLESWAPDAVVDWSNSRGLEARIYRGHVEIRAFAQQFREAFEDFRVELLDLVEVSEGVLVAENITYLHGRDGVPVQARSAWLITIQDGQQTSLTLYQTEQEALEAVRLSSQKNVELARRVFASADPSAFYALFSEDIEYDMRATPLPDFAELFRGREAVLEFFRRYWGTWTDYAVVANEIIGNGNEVFIDIAR
jgi:ketosteroid isomerase-like protein